MFIIHETKTAKNKLTFIDSASMNFSKGLERKIIDYNTKTQFTKYIINCVC